MRRGALLAEQLAVDEDALFLPGTGSTTTTTSSTQMLSRTLRSARSALSMLPRGQVVPGLKPGNQDRNRERRLQVRVASPLDPQRAHHAHEARIAAQRVKVRITRDEGVDGEPVADRQLEPVQRFIRPAAARSSARTAGSWA
jgi:hypothetical protein